MFGGQTPRRPRARLARVSNKQITRGAIQCTRYWMFRTYSSLYKLRRRGKNPRTLLLIGLVITVSGQVKLVASVTFAFHN